MDAHFAASFQPNTSNAHATGEWPGQIKSGRRGSTSRLHILGEGLFCERAAEAAIAILEGVDALEPEMT